MRLKKGTFYAGIISIISGTIFLCSSRKQVVVLPDQSVLSESTEHSDSLTENLKTDETGTLIVEPQNWVNEQFVLLAKPVMFRRFGYELFRCPDLSSCARVDTFYELSNRRLKYERFCLDTLTVKGVTPDEGGEWLIEFLDKRYSINLFVRTKKSALQEMVFLKDFDAAYRRWRGKTVFSRKGVISVELPGGNLSSEKVKRYDSLKVTDVRYGLSPLPVNPIWLMVTTGKGTEGFIAVRFSWTNTMSDQVSESLSWRDDIAEVNPMQQYDWDATTWEVIESHRITVGMNKDQVTMSWGRPLKIVDTTLNNSKVQCWNYAAQKLYFDDNSLITIEDQGNSK